MNTYHQSVLLSESIDLLQIKPKGKYLDATLGGGGHSERIIFHGGEVLAMDTDQDALDFASNKFKAQKSIKLVKGNFTEIEKTAHQNSFNNLDGIIFDLGVSSHQFDDPSRGFSYRYESLLDMRMDQKNQTVTAADLVNSLTQEELSKLFTRLGEEPFAKVIAKMIVQGRKVEKIITTEDLCAIIRSALRNKGNISESTTRVFQALRIAVNDELNSLRDSLPQALLLLKPGGRIAVIAFHSLEDRIVKNQFLVWEEQQKGKIITKKPIVPEAEEIAKNYRSRSAKLRVFEKL